MGQSPIAIPKYVIKKRAEPAFTSAEAPSRAKVLLTRAILRNFLYIKNAVSVAEREAFCDSNGLISIKQRI